MGLSVYAPTPILVIIATSLAFVACLVMFNKGHNMMIPMAFSIGWIGIGYLLGQVGADHDDTSAIIRSGIIILCADVIVGSLIWMRGRKSHESG